MPKGVATCNNFLALLYNATAWANIADNAASSPITQIKMALATASYVAASTLSTNESAVHQLCPARRPTLRCGMDGSFRWCDQ